MDATVASAAAAGNLTNFLAIAQTIFSGLVVILTFLYVLTTRHQLKEMRQALEETRRSNDATDKSNDIAERSLQIGQRAYITGKGILTVNMFTAEITVENAGATPATNVSMWSCVIYIKDSSIIPEKIERGEGEAAAEMVLGAGRTFTQMVAIPPVKSSDGIKIALDQAQLIAYCEVDYRDVFGKQHRTTACWLHVPGTPVGRDWKLAPRHNRLEY